jgi:hypothetical protein
MSDDRIARICWNTEGWRKPSGAKGKSKNARAYEHHFGYGHEEWLLDTTRLIDGWHYGYLQPIGLHRDKYVGQEFNIGLYSINDETKGRWWVGSVMDVQVVGAEESAKVHSIYRTNGWLEEMEGQLVAIGAKVEGFQKVDPADFVVVKYRPQNLELLESPLAFACDDPVVKAEYYVLLNRKSSPRLVEGTKAFSFLPGHKPRKAATKATYQRQSSEIDLVHNRIQANLFAQFVKKYGQDNVGGLPPENRTRGNERVSDNRNRVSS